MCVDGQSDNCGRQALAFQISSATPIPQHGTDLLAVPGNLAGAACSPRLEPICQSWTARERTLMATARQLINNPKNVVDEMIDGVTLNPDLQRIEGYNVVVRATIDKSKVALISGGGSGHEPSHAGWVGAGMLTAAVAGPVFA
eukprot:jgi/Chrpa1/2434/Chrysochromulina_OHIO_Genome00009551-RA